ncbi:MAG: S8 family serine peptidase, partial [Bacteroidota bacterium]
MNVTTGNLSWLIFVFLSLVFSIPLHSQQTVQEVLIKFDESSAEPQLKKSMERTFGKKLHYISQTPYAKLRLKKNQTFKQFKHSPEITPFLNSGLIIDIEANYTYEMSVLPDDPDISQQWGLENTGQEGGTAGSDIQADLAWDIQRKGRGILGIVDTGVDFTHPDLVENIWQNLAEDADGDGRVLEQINGVWQLDPGDLDGIDADGNGYVDDLVGWDFVNNDNNPFDDNGHGTHVAGIAAARGNNAQGISGVAWEAEVMVLKAFDAYGTGQLSHILPALAYARKMGVFLTNNSWGSVHQSRFLLEEIIQAQERGQIFVAAAGNSGRYNPLQPIYPASYPSSNIISVAASDNRDQIASFSSYSSSRITLAAPGHKIYSSLPGNRYAFKSGTSMAAPFVAGAVLLIHAYRPNLTIQDIRETLLHGVDRKVPLFGKTQSNGRLNIYQSLQAHSGSITQLKASFQGPKVSCINTSFRLSSTSEVPFPDQTSYDWKLNGKSLGNSPNLSHSIDQAGWYEFQLTLSDPDGSSSFTGLIEIRPKASAQLSADSVLCSNAYILYAGTEAGNIRWKKLPCLDPNFCDPQSTDSISIETSGIDLGGMEGSYVLTNGEDKIMEVYEESAFLPAVIAGQYRLYGVYYEIGKRPQHLLNGKYIYELDFGADPCASISSPYLLEVEGGELIGESPFLTVSTSGSYLLEVEDACGNIASDTINLKLLDGCVWPGDVNADGTVSMLDFLLLGIANQERGASRSNASPAWEGQLANNWLTSFENENPLAPGINLKHADCDGNGQVDLQSDAQVLINNLGFLHSLDGLPIGEGPSFSLEHVHTTFSTTGDTAAIELAIYLSGPDSSEIENFYGMAFSLNFSSPIVETPDINPSQDWLGPMETLSLLADGSQNAFGSKFLPRDRKSASIGFVSANRRSSRGRGLAGGGVIIVTVEDIVDDSLQNGLSNFNISSDNVMIIDSSGNPISSHSGNSLSLLDIELDWEEEKVEINPALRWVDFSVKGEGRKAVLDWETREEINVQKFIIERSADGRLFEYTGELAPRTNPHLPSFYTFTDLGFPSYNTLFYRIRAVDIEGKISFSKIRSLEISTDELNNFEVYPNPFSDELEIVSHTKKDT